MTTFADRVKETTTTTGVGALTLAGAATSYQTFVAGLGLAATCHYAITDGTDWEVGIGTVGSATLSRDRVIASSNSGSAVSWTAGTKDVWATASAEAWETVQTRRFTESAHGFSPGEPVYFDGSNWLSAQATDERTKAPNGIVLAAPTSDLFVMALCGLVGLTAAQWDTVAGTSGGLTPGSTYYVSGTAGLLTSVLNGTAMVVGRALSATVLLVELARGWGVVDVVDFAPTTGVAHKEGRVYYDSALKAFTVFVDEADIALQVGQEVWLRTRNNTGSTISNGDVVYISGSTANLPTIAPALADSTIAAAHVLGFATHDIENNTNGYITLIGSVRGLDTSAFTEGTEIFLSATTPGAWVSPAPAAPAPTVALGTVLDQHASNGIVHAHIDEATLGVAIAEHMIFSAANPDVGIKRSAAGTLQVTDGAAGFGALDVRAISPSADLIISPASGQDVIFNNSGNLRFRGASSVQKLYLGADLTGQGFIHLADQGVLAWSSNTAIGYPADIGLARSAAGVLRVTDGGAGAGAVTALTFRGTGSGTPEGAVTAPVGSLFLRTDGGTGTTLYVKETGAGDTGWVAVGAGGGGGTPWHFWVAEAGIAYGANPAAFSTRNGHGVLCFDDSTEEAIVFQGVAHVDLASGDVTVDVEWLGATATTGDVVWSVAFERGNTDLDADSFNTAKTATSTTNGASGSKTTTSITFTIAEADGVTARDPIRLLLKRVAADGSDTMVGDAQVLRFTLRQ